MTCRWDAELAGRAVRRQVVRAATDGAMDATGRPMVRVTADPTALRPVVATDAARAAADLAEVLVAGPVADRRR